MPLAPPGRSAMSAPRWSEDQIQAGAQPIPAFLQRRDACVAGGDCEGNYPRRSGPLQLATAHIRAGERVRAEQLLGAIQKAPGQSAQVQLVRGLLGYSAREYGRAEAQYRKAS